MFRELSDDSEDGESYFRPVGSEKDARAHLNKSRRKEHSHRSACMRLLLGMEGFEDLPRYTLFAVAFFYLCMAVACFYTFDLIGYIYQKSFSDYALSGVTRRFIGLWLTVLTTLMSAFVYLVGMFISLRCCGR